MDKAYLSSQESFLEMAEDPQPEALPEAEGRSPSVLRGIWVVHYNAHHKYP